jgi:hypothetical protein
LTTVAALCERRRSWVFGFTRRRAHDESNRRFVVAARRAQGTKKQGAGTPRRAYAVGPLEAKGEILLLREDIMQIGKLAAWLNALDPGSRDRVRSATRPAVLWSLGMLFFVAISASAQEAAEKTGGADASKATVLPRVVVMVHMARTELAVQDIKYRGFYNKAEQKFIPLADYNFAANLADELVGALADDRRATWAVPGPDEQKALAACIGANWPDWWRHKTATLPPLEADRLLAIGARYEAFVQALVKRLDVIVTFQMVDRTTGRVLWKKTMLEGMKLPGTIEELQVDNQKGLKEALNKLAEQMAPKMRQHIAKQRI